MKPQARQFLTPVVQRQRGVALVTILIVVALASLLATALITSHKLSITHAASLLEQGQVTSHALSGEAVARALLREEIVQDQDGVLHKEWRQWKEHLEVEDAKIFVRIEDLQGLFDLNRLTEESYVSVFNHLLTLVQVNPALAPLATDWIDTDVKTSLYGAEDGDYLLESPPFRTANNAFHSVLELGILGRQPIDSELLDRLYPLVTALPFGGGQKLNINNLHPLVLKALAPERITEQIVQRVSQRSRPFANATELGEDLPQLNEIVTYLDFSSSYFRADVYVQFRQRYGELSSVIYRNPETGRTNIISRQLQLPPWLKLPDEEEGEG